MPILTEQRKRQKNLIIVIFLVVTVAIFVLYFGRLRQDLPEATTTGDSSQIAQGAREIRLNVKLLEDNRFKKLIPYETLSRDIATGRNNPFAPYRASEPPYVREQIEAQEVVALQGENSSTSTIP